MGALHEGHLSLIRKAKKENDICLLSIFVNPLQFGPREDFHHYPRPVRSDNLLAKKEKVDIIFHPSGKSMYPSGFLTTVEVAQLSDALCGRSRPGHFRGVTTVVAKLLNIVGPNIMYLGQKDAQQAIILKRMVADLNFPTTIKICPTVREKGGLALSSRNKYLTARHRQQAAILYRSLKEAKGKIKSGERRATAIIRHIRSRIEKMSAGRIDYVACVDARTLVPLQTIRGHVMLALAVKFGEARLIDNIIFKVS